MDLSIIRPLQNPQQQQRFMKGENRTENHFIRQKHSELHGWFNETSVAIRSCQTITIRSCSRCSQKNLVRQLFFQDLYACVVCLAYFTRVLLDWSHGKQHLLCVAWILKGTFINNNMRLLLYKLKADANNIHDQVSQENSQKRFRHFHKQVLFCNF